MNDSNRSGLRNGLTVGAAMASGYLASRFAGDSIWLRSLAAAAAAGLAAGIVTLLFTRILRKRDV